MAQAKAETKEVALSFEQAVVLKGRKAIEFFSDIKNVEPLIEIVREKATSTILNVNKKKDRELIGSLALNVSKSRKLLTDAIKASTAELQEKVKQTKDVNKIWEEKLNTLRTEVLAPRDEWQEKENQKEENRIAGIKEEIFKISELCVLQGTETKQGIANLIDAVEGIDVSEGYEEFAQDAAQAVKDALKTLNDRVLEIVEQDRKEEQSRLLEEANKKNLITERLHNLSSTPMTMFGASADQIQKKIDNLKSYEVPAEEFGDSYDIAVNSVKVVLSQLDVMLAQQVLIEDAAKQAEERRKLELEEAQAQVDPELVAKVEKYPNDEFSDQSQDNFEANQDGPVKGGVFVFGEQTTQSSGAGFNRVSSHPDIQDSDYQIEPQVMDQAIVNFLQCQLHDVTDFGYLLVSNDPRHQEEAVANLRAKFQAFNSGK